MKLMSSLTPVYDFTIKWVILGRVDVYWLICIDNGQLHLYVSTLSLRLHLSPQN